MGKQNGRYLSTIEAALCLNLRKNIKCLHQNSSFRRWKYQDWNIKVVHFRCKAFANNVLKRWRNVQVDFWHLSDVKIATKKFLSTEKNKISGQKCEKQKWVWSTFVKLLLTSSRVSSTPSLSICCSFCFCCCCCRRRRFMFLSLFMLERRLQIFGINVTRLFADVRFCQTCRPVQTF